MWVLGEAKAGSRDEVTRRRDRWPVPESVRQGEDHDLYRREIAGREETSIISLGKRTEPEMSADQRRSETNLARKQTMDARFYICVDYTAGLIRLMVDQ